MVTSLGLRILLTDLQPAASRAAEARRAIADFHRKIAFVDQDHDTKLEHQLRADRAPGHRRRATGHDTPNH